MDNHNLEPMPASKFNKSQLIKRLNVMEIHFDPVVQTKENLDDLYNQAIKYEENRAKIQNLLDADLKAFLETRKKRVREESEEPRKDSNIEGKSAKIERKNLSIVGEFGSNSKKETHTLTNLITTTNKDRKLSNIPDEKNKNNPILPFNNNFNLQDLIPTKKIISDYERSRKTEISKPNISAPENPEIRNTVSTNAKLNFISKINLNTLPADKALKKSPIKSKPAENNDSEPFSIIRSATYNHNNINKTSINNKTNPYNNINSQASKVNYIDNTPKEKFSFNFANEGSKPKRQTTDFLQSQTNLPVVQNVPRASDFFKQEISTFKRINSNRSIENSNIPPTNNRRINDFVINGGVPSPQRIIVNNISNLDVKEPEVVLKSNNLMKYFIVGTSCAIMAFGLYYVVQNSNIGWDTFGMNRNIIEPGKEFTTNTVNSEVFNHQLGNLNSAKDNIVGGGIFARYVTEPFYAFTDFFKKIAHYLVNPQETLKNLTWYLVKNAGEVTLLYLWNNLKTNILYYAAIILARFILYRSYSYYTNRKVANKSFEDLKYRLKNMYDSNLYTIGISEEEIVNDYSKSNNMKEDYFRANIFPRMKNLRRDDGYIKEFETFINGRNRTAWQWAGY